MASPSPTELARNAQQHSDNLRIEFDLFKEEMVGLQLQQIRERMTAVETTVAELKRIKEESEKKRSQWVFWGIGALVTLIGTFVVQLLLNWIKK